MLVIFVVPLILGGISVLPLPEFATRSLFNRFAPWILAGDANSSALSTAARRGLGLYLYQNIVDNVYANIKFDPDATEIQRAAKILETAKKSVLTQGEIWHESVNAPPVFSGFAWCDAANGLAARLLAEEFGTTEIVGVYDETAKAGHSFGRFWSPTEKAWLYFDIWPDNYAIFRSLPGNKIQYLAYKKAYTVNTDEEPTASLIRRTHANVRTNFVHNRLQSNFGSYVVSRISNIVFHGHSAPSTAKTDIAAIAMPAPFPANRLRRPDLWIAARVEHYFGTSAAAVAAYRLSANAERGAGTPYEMAANAFADRVK